MSETTSRQRRRSLGPWLRIVIGVALVYWLLRYATPDFALLVGVWRDWTYLLAALGMAVLVQTLGAWRWGRILHGQGIKISAAEVQGSCWVASFLNQALLGTVGGDAYRIGRARTATQAPLVILIGSVLTDRLTGLWLALALAPLAWPFAGELLDAEPDLRTWLWGILIFLVVSAALLAASYSPTLRRCLGALPGATRIGHRLQGLKPFLKRLGTDRMGLFWLFGLGLLTQALVVLIHILLAKALFPDLAIDPVVFFLVIPIAICAISLPINPPGAVGTAEAIYQFLLGLCGVPDGAILALLLRLVLLTQCLPGAVLWLLRRPHSKTSTKAS